MDTYLKLARMQLQVARETMSLITNIEALKSLKGELNRDCMEIERRLMGNAEFRMLNVESDFMRKEKKGQANE